MAASIGRRGWPQPANQRTHRRHVPLQWKAAVEARMSELVQQLHEAEPPRSKEEEVALKLL